MSHIYRVEYYSAIKTNKNAICSNTDGPRDYHTEWGKSDTKKQISYDINYMWNLKKRVQMNWLTKQKESHRCTDTENKHGYGEMGKGGLNRETGIDIYTLHTQNRQLMRTCCIAQELGSVLHNGLWEKNLKRKEWIYV